MNGEPNENELCIIGISKNLNKGESFEMENNKNNFQNEARNVEKEVNNENIAQGNEKAKSKKRKAIALIVIVVILALAVGIGVGIFVSGKGKTDSSQNTQQENKTSKKIDESKPWVYDAEYGKDKKNKVVENFYNSNEELIVPYININSEDAEKANSEIKKLYEEIYSSFGSKNSYNAEIIYKAEYKYYENDNIISVVLRVGDAVANGGAGTSKLYVYNFNLDTLKTATLSEMAKLCGFNSESDVTNKVKQWEKRQESLANANKDKVAAQMTGIVDGLYYIDANKKLNFVYISLAAGTYYTPEVIEVNKEIKDFYEFDDTNVSTNNNDITIKEDFFSLVLPSSWAGKYKYDIATGNEADSYIFFTKTDNAELFRVIRSNKPIAGQYGTTLIKKDSLFYYYFHTPTDTPSNTSEYAELYKDVDKIRNTVNINEEKTENNNVSSNNNSSQSNSTYAEEYIKIIDKEKNENPNSNITCDLIYFNNDNVPDLVIGMQWYWVSLYIYEDGKVYNPIDQWAYGAMGNTGYHYFEKKGTILNYNSDYAGGIMTKTISIFNSNHKFDFLSYRGKGADIESTDPVYEEIQKELKETGGYYYNDQKISEQEYNNKLKEFSINDDTNNYKVLDGNTKTIEEVKQQLQQK